MVTKQLSRLKKSLVFQTLPNAKCNKNIKPFSYFGFGFLLKGYVVGNDDVDYNDIVNPDWNTCMIHIYDRSQLKGSYKRVTNSFRLTSGVVKSMRNGRGDGNCCWRIWR